MARRRLDESTSKRLQEWVADLNLTDLDRNVSQLDGDMKKWENQI